MNALERWQAAISSNLAAGSVAGFKKDETSFSSALSGSTRYEESDDSSPDIKHYVPQATTRVSDTQGTLHQTGKDLDFGVQGPGYFKVQSSSGSPAYTRNGEFHIDATGKLVNNSGAQVQGESGGIAIDPTLGPVSVDKTGQISQGTTTVGKLALFDLTKVGELKRSADGLVVPANGDTPPKVDKPEVLQGYTEDSNVVPMQEMVNLIQVSRAYEVSQKLITTLDQTSRSAVETLGTP